MEKFSYSGENVTSTHEKKGLTTGNKLFRYVLTNLLEDKPTNLLGKILPRKVQASMNLKMD